MFKMILNKICQFKKNKVVKLKKRKKKTLHISLFNKEYVNRYVVNQLIRNHRNFTLEVITHDLDIFMLAFLYSLVLTKGAINLDVTPT